MEFERIISEPKSLKKKQSVPDLIFKKKESDNLFWLEETEADFTAEHKRKKDIKKGKQVEINVYENADDALVKIVFTCIWKKLRKNYFEYAQENGLQIKGVLLVNCTSLIPVPDLPASLQKQLSDRQVVRSLKLEDSHFAEIYLGFYNETIYKRDFKKIWPQQIFSNN